MSKRKKRLLVACEESQRVTSAFRALGYDAFSCDTKATSGDHPEWHIQGDALVEAYSGKYEMMIGHPPCTFLSVSGACWMYHPEDRHLPTSERRPHPLHLNRKYKQREAIQFFMALWNAPIKHIVLENPVSIMSTKLRKPTQIIQPYNFGENASKRTCLWMTSEVPLLVPTGEIAPIMVGGKKRWANQYQSEHGGSRVLHPKTGIVLDYNDPLRATIRSRTYQGIANSFAIQWSHLLQ